MRGNWNVYIIVVGSGIVYWLATGIPSAIQKRASKRLNPSIPPFMIGHFFFAVVTVACWYATAQSAHSPRHCHSQVTCCDANLAAC